MKKFFLFLNLIFPAFYYSNLPSISSRSSVSSCRENIIMQKTMVQEAKNEHYINNTQYANDYGDSIDKPSADSSKKKLYIVIFGLLITGLLTYNYLNNQTNENPIII